MLQHDEMTVAIKAARRWVDQTGAIGISDASLTQLVTVIIQAVDDLWASQKPAKSKPKAGEKGDSD